MSNSTRSAKTLKWQRDFRHRRPFLLRHWTKDCTNLQTTFAGNNIYLQYVRNMSEWAADLPQWTISFLKFEEWRVFVSPSMVRHDYDTKAPLLTQNHRAGVESSSLEDNLILQSIIPLNLCHLLWITYGISGIYLTTQKVWQVVWSPWLVLYITIVRGEFMPPSRHPIRLRWLSKYVKQRSMVHTDDKRSIVDRTDMRCNGVPILLQGAPLNQWPDNCALNLATFVINM